MMTKANKAEMVMTLNTRLRMNVAEVNIDAVYLFTVELHYYFSPI